MMGPLVSANFLPVLSKNSFGYFHSLAGKQTNPFVYTELFQQTQQRIACLSGLVAFIISMFFNQGDFKGSVLH